MKKFNLHFSIKVLGSKYRELLNILETEQQSVLPSGCISRTIYQSIENLNSLSYLERWEDLDLLKKSMEGDRYEYVVGAIKNLSQDWSIEVFEQIEINKFQKTV
ncbi:hypothetical protein LCM02_14420 [Lutimonas saemankumensis]|uniref:hypothetical protein n=1 Tax=Lutimonas saemankumensis TaxID=483016 RepID=UPI001CD1E93D|nr:hypothetical protein [Lutimonas saemankumensis]MCA0933656.1 hypothetical protein [Lutimonas saemankumensis]